MSATSRNQVFSAVHTVGALLPADMLVRISEGKDVPGSKPADYNLPTSRSVRDEAERSWEYLKPLWRELRTRLPEDPETGALAGDPTGLAAGEWLAPLWRELGFGRLTPMGSSGLPADSDVEKVFPVSHRWGHALIHQAAWNADLDRRPGGAGTVPPQSMLQECLNRTEAHLWGVLTNGRQVRLLRDSSALATASYVEFDLEAIFDGELFSEFVLLYRLLHVSRFEVGEETAPSACWLEKWRTEAIASGTRALDQLRMGVQTAITTLGTGFLKHPDNRDLRETVDITTFHNALLRLVYRLLFLFVAEDREVLLAPSADAGAKERYATYFSSARLRRHARRRRGTAHGDLYQALCFVLSGLGNDDGRPELGLPALGGIFDDTETDKVLHGLALSNVPLLEAVRALSIVRDTGSKRNRVIDYHHLDAEELGSIYESLLELVPQHNATERTFELVELAGNARKTTGSYYTPSSLIDCLLDSALDPVIDDAVKRGEIRATRSGQPDARDAIVEELLGLTVCDPACGSGHFLVAAARRIAKRVAAIREQNPEPTLDAVRHALHEVVARCIYGVDLNPMAVELAKVSLWLEALEPGKPLGFLDAHIKHGNALLGATPALLAGGIPDDAFKPIEGDDNKIASAVKRRNAAERSGQLSFHTEERIWVSNASFAASLRNITAAPADTLRDVRLQSSRFRDLEQSATYLRALHISDAWCAAFVWNKNQGAPTPVTEGVFRDLQSVGAGIPVTTDEEIIRLAQQYKFFHWHLEFPEVFTVSADSAPVADVDPATGWAGGFSCVVGNPPWDKVDFEDKKYFSVVEPSIADISGTARRTRIAEWETKDPEAGARYRAARRMVKSTFLFAGESGAFPLCARGLTVKGVNSLQTDQLFAERFSAIAAPKGRFGCIIPTAIATGAGAQHLFGDFSRRGAIASLYDFENRKPLFVGVHSSYKFCLLSLTGRDLREPAAKFAFFLEDTIDLDDADRVFALSPEEIALLNPNTGTLPIFRSRRDADLTAGIYERVLVLWNETKRGGNPWGITFKRLFDMTDDSDLFRTREALLRDGWELEGNAFVRAGERMLPLYEGKMAHHFDHRWNSYHGTGNEDRRRLEYAEKQTPSAAAHPRYWIAEGGNITTVRKNKPVEVPGVDKRLDEVRWERDWLIGWRDVCRTTDERTAIPAFLPRTAVGHKFPLMFPGVPPHLTAALVAAQSSMVFDFVSRQKIGSTSMGLFIWKQLPVPTPGTMSLHAPFLSRRVLELVYTAHDMAGLARDLDDEGAPFRWDEDRRAQLRAELDAYFFHLYGMSRDDADYILETFQTEPKGGLKYNEIAKYGEYRTKRLVLAEYDRMAVADVSLETPLVEGENYTSTLTPPPGHGPRHPGA
ncbi:Eco57I restriction-modification methylase domain-containing protein [Streptomyces sp. 061-3]|uniref:Eco57I restriction-modification methylase domain-containing protein n=1 Tax=Streptomyces sp. 061-3 TaxID=2789268 RepID=UPI0039808230